MKQGLVRFISMIVPIGLIAAAIGAQPALVEKERVSKAQSITLRITGTTESFSLALCPSGSVGLDSELHSVSSLYTLTTEVTWDLYDIYIYKLDEPEEGSESDGISRPSKPYVPPDRGFGHEGYPAIGMTQKAAIGFCEWLSVKTGLEVRLPTAPEWVHIAKGESKGSYCCGADKDSAEDIGWFAENAEHSTHPVGLKNANGYGLYDVHGNAAEWVISDSRKPIAYGGGYRDPIESSTLGSYQRQNSSWNQSDPQIPKSQWWLADCSWVGFRFVIDADTVDLEKLEELTDVTIETD